MTICNDPLPLARTPLHALHARQSDSEWISLGDTATPAQVAGPASAPTRLAQCGLIDLSALARIGIRGSSAAEALRERGYHLPEVPNRCQAQDNGRRVARLSPTEYLLLAGMPEAGPGPIDAADDWLADDWLEGVPGCYALPRQDSHAWLALTGEHATAVMAKLCAVDLDAAAFPEGHIAQTSVARIDTIVIRDRLGATPCLHLLVDSAAASYLWPALLDAMQEFGGQPLGITALLTP
jgi:sarcosine oxidase subunit gamma